MPTPRSGAIRAGSWKLVVARRPRQPGASDRVELFDLAHDPNEKVDLAATQPEKMAELRARLDAFESACRETAPEASTAGVWGETE